MSIPRAIHIKVLYSTSLATITGCAEEDHVISEGMNFVLFLRFLFTTYPEIHRRYPPGNLGFLVNNRPPQEGYVLQHGDHVYFTGTK